MTLIWNDVVRVKQGCRHFAESTVVYPVVSPTHGILRMPLYNWAFWAGEREFQPFLCFRTSLCCSVAEQGSPSWANMEHSPYTTPDVLLQLAFVRIWAILRRKTWVNWKEIERGKRIAGSEEKRRTFPFPGQKCLCSYSLLTFKTLWAMFSCKHQS